MKRSRTDGAPVLLAGAFGQGNPGDEALLDAFRRALPDTPLVVASSDPADTQWRHGLTAIPSYSWRAVTSALSSSRALVFAGGTVFKVLPASTGRQRWALLRNALALAAYARAAGRPVCMVGVGVGDLPDPTSRILARRIAKQADLLVLRDVASARALIRIGVPGPLRVGADAAWTLLDQVPEPHDTAGEHIVVVPSQWAVATAPGVLAALSLAVQPLLSDGFAVRVQPWQCGGPGPDDFRYAEQLAAGLSGDVELTAPILNLVDAARAFTAARLVVSSRFHALVAAAAAGTPFLAVANEHKQAGIADRLDQPSVAAAAPASSMADALHEALATAPPAHAAVRAEIAAAEEALGLMRLVVSGGAVSAESISGLRLEPAW
jgi:polysaccharide pyruvyl transferase WcaK-like protein